MRDYLTHPQTRHINPVTLPPLRSVRDVNIAAEALRTALGRFLAGTDQPGQLLAAMLENAPLLCRYDEARAGMEDRNKEFGDGE